MLVGKPTYWAADPKKIPDLIDFAIIKGLTKLEINIKSSDNLSSDFSPVRIMLDEPVDNSQPNKKLTTQNSNWLKYKKIFSSHIDLNPSLESNADIEIFAERLNEVVISAARHSTLE